MRHDPSNDDSLSFSIAVLPCDHSFPERFRIAVLASPELQTPPLPVTHVWARSPQTEEVASLSTSLLSLEAIYPATSCRTACAHVLRAARDKYLIRCGKWVHSPDATLMTEAISHSADPGGIASSIRPMNTRMEPLADSSVFWPQKPWSALHLLFVLSG